jgi:FkbM family methyltransferase
MNILTLARTKIENTLEDFSFVHKSIKRDCSIRGAHFLVYSWHPRSWRLQDSIPLSWMLDNVSGEDILYDIGANRGYYALAVMAVHRSAQVFAFEPNPEIATKLRLNVELNGWSGRARLSEFGLGEKHDRLKLNIALSDSASSFDPQRARKAGWKIRRQADSLIMSLDECISQLGMPIPQHIKIDTEGYEKPILLGAKNVLKQAHPKLYVEAHPLSPNDATVSDLLTLMHGYKYSIIQEDRFLYGY